MTFPVHRVDRRRAQQVEPLGSKRKFWYRDDERRLLFKAEDRGTGEDWAEVVSCHLCRLLGLPHVEYELASEFDNDTLVRPGVICANMALPPDTLVLGNQLLLSLDWDYPSTQRFKVKQHTVEAVETVVSGLKPPSSNWMTHVPSGIRTSFDVFVGYLLLDVWIANQDRHHENWGAIWDGEALRLSPTFDHGAALARNLLDTERADRLRTNNQNRSLAAFATRARSAFFGSVLDSRTLPLLDAFLLFAQQSRTAAAIWLNRLQAVNMSAVSSILDEVPVERMSTICRDFTLNLLEANRQRVLKLELK